MSASRSVRFTFYLFVALLLLAGTIVLFEIYFRLADRYGREGVTWISNKGVTGIEYSPTEIWHWRSFMSDRIINAEGDTIIVHTDQFGFRNYGRSLRKPDSVIRILILGDSYTEALNIADDRIFPALLQQNLADLRPAGKTIEVLSASSPAWSTEQELLCLQNEAAQFAPDYVLLMACPNDIREAWCKKFAVPAGNGNIKFNPINISRGERFLWWLSNRSRLFQYLQQEVFHTDYGAFVQLRAHYVFNFGKADSANWDRPLFLKKPFPQVDSARSLFTDLIAQMQQHCTKHNIHFAVSLSPTQMEFNGTIGTDSSTQSGLVSDQLQTYCQRSGIDYINLYDRFKAQDNTAACFMKPDAHFSSHAHRITADILAGYYRKILNKK
jgi:lysophospholipase L1-like esterase